MVRQDRRRDGIGSRLLATWAADMRAEGAELLITSSMADEPEPRAWRRRNGFPRAAS